MKQKNVTQDIGCSYHRNQGQILHSLLVHVQLRCQFGGFHYCHLYDLNCLRVNVQHHPLHQLKLNDTDIKQLKLRFLLCTNPVR